MSVKTLAADLRLRGLTLLAQHADTLVYERNTALRDAWKTREENDRLRQRLHEVVAENNALRRDR